MAAPKITLYVDTVSPFAYIAYHVLRHDAAFRNCQISYVPILLGGVMKACGTQAPISIKNKDRWIERERYRWAKLFNIPMKPSTPPNFPPLTLGIMRHLAVLDSLDSSSGNRGQERLIAALDALYHAYWVEHQETIKPDVLRGILVNVLGSEDTDKINAMTTTPEGKQMLMKNTDKALADGAFGLPWMVCTNAKGETEAFWGVDHLGQIAAFLGIDRPQTHDGWKAVL